MKLFWYHSVVYVAEVGSTASFKRLYQLVPFAANKEITARENYAQQDAIRRHALSSGRWTSGATRGR